MNVDGSKIIFAFGVLAAMATAGIALYFSMR
jgi:hypothetical protein